MTTTVIIFGILFCLLMRISLFWWIVGLILLIAAYPISMAGILLVLIVAKSLL
jgi:hypothetical protein